MQQRNFTIMLMRDDQEAKTIRISGRSALWCLLCAAVLAAAVLSALGFGLHSLVGLHRLKAERGDLEERLANVLVELERKRNLQLLTAGREPRPAAEAAGIATPGRAERLARTDSGGCAVENLSARRARGGLAVSFDLVNRGEEEAVGKIRLLLLDRDGEARPLDPAEGAQSYRIQRRKHVAAQLRPSPGQPLSEGQGLRVEVTDAKGAVIFGETASIEN